VFSRNVGKFLPDCLTVTAAVIFTAGIKSLSHCTRASVYPDPSHSPPTTRGFLFCRPSLLESLTNCMCLPFYSFCLSCAGFGVRFLSKESFITSKLSLCVLSLTPLRFLKALLIFVTQKLNFLSLLFIVVDFLLEYGETLKGEKYPFERILYSSLLKMSFVQQNSMKFGGMGGGGVGERVRIYVCSELNRIFFPTPFQSHLSLQWIYCCTLSSV
jgi:hypothetical protein